MKAVMEPGTDMGALCVEVIGANLVLGNKTTITTLRSGSYSWY